MTYKHEYTWGYPYKEGIKYDSKKECQHENKEWYNPYWFELALRCKDCGKRL